MNIIALAKEELGKIGAVLARGSGDQCNGIGRHTVELFVSLITKPLSSDRASPSVSLRRANSRVHHIDGIALEGPPEY
jgi:hypothetical protein